ncbi:MAG TPA: hypothetical protein VF046_04975 [Gemmatimonadales bacterium]
MLPPGLAAHPVDRTERHRLHPLHPHARTVIHLVVGACACDLVRARHPDPREDERHHRERYRRAGMPRAAVIADLERHRRGAEVDAPPDGWPRALAAFVAEHARNAGETLYLLRFAPGTVPPDHRRRHLTAAQVLARPHEWLEEDVPTLVVP